MGARSRSLFWTFAGTFLLVIGAASVVQFVVGIAVLRPLAERATRDRAELAAAAAAQAIVAAPSLDRDVIRDALRAGLAERGVTIVVFVSNDGRMIPDRFLPPGINRRATELVGLAPHDGPGGGLEPPDRNGPPGTDPRGPRDDLPPPGARLGVLARRAVARQGAAAGEVFALGALGPTGVLPPLEPGGMLLVLPFAVLAAGAAGLVMVRLLVRRLRALDHLAARIAAGDLAARIEDSSGDEIGRLGERLNRMIDRLAAARAELESTDRQRRQLLADISHELATPLTSIRGYAETLLNPAIPSSPAERDTYLHHVLEESERLDRLIRDLLELARLESGGMPLVLERLDWAALCRNTIERFTPRFRAAGLALAWRGGAAEAWVRADGRRLEQVLDNLLANALRYVPGGGAVELEIESAGERHRLAVCDDGPGIADADLPHVFERFWRAESARESQGSGLGLAIVKEIVLHHGGAVSAQRRAPRGTRFEIELPVDRSR